MIIFLILLSTLLMTSNSTCASYTTCLMCVNQTTCEYNITGSNCINRPLVIHPLDMYYVPLPLKRQTNTMEYATQSTQCPISRIPIFDTLHLSPLPFILDTTVSYYTIDSTTPSPYSTPSTPSTPSTTGQTGATGAPVPHSPPYSSSYPSSYSTFVINDGSGVYHTAVQQPTNIQNSSLPLFLSLAIIFIGLVSLI